MGSGGEQVKGTAAYARRNVSIASKVAGPALLVVAALSGAGVLVGAVDVAAQRPWIAFVMTCVLTLLTLVALTTVRRWNRTPWLPVLPFGVMVLGFILGLDVIVTWSVVAIVVAAAVHGQFVEKRSGS
jgi:hypothetical protein